MLAIVHDWIFHLRGGEKVLKHILEMFVDCDLFAMFFKKNIDPVFDKRFKKASFLNFLPYRERYYRYLLPLYPLGVYQLNRLMKSYDSIISISHCVAKNVYGHDVENICYCLSPFRPLYDLRYAYAGNSTLKDVVFDMFKLFDASFDRQKVKFIAISEFVSNRIKAAYGLSPIRVVYPPCEVDHIPLRDQSYKNAEFYVTGGALVENKNFDLVIQAFNDLKLPLFVFGSGPVEKKLKRMARENIKFLGWVSQQTLNKLFLKAKAFIFPSVEDFGLTTVEFLASGGPVIGLNMGGTREILESPETWFGYLLDPEKSIVDQMKDKIIEIELGRSPELAPLDARKRALKFSPERFREEFVNCLYSVSSASVKYLKAW
ncbi:MAG: glycosyltransferase [Deltaproteobacteria bacterium]|nr:glycosyltransferase [Deltaproteobacteria bacterium]